MHTHLDAGSFAGLFVNLALIAALLVEFKLWVRFPRAASHAPHDRACGAAPFNPDTSIDGLTVRLAVTASNDRVVDVELGARVLMDNPQHRCDLRDVRATNHARAR